MTAQQETIFPQPWPHIYAPGEPKLFSDLSLAEFCAGYAVILQNCQSMSSREQFLQYFHIVTMLACSYKWSAVRAFHAKVLRSIELGLIKWGDSFKHLKQPFFIPTALLDDPSPKIRNMPSRLTTAFTSCPFHDTKSATGPGMPPATTLIVLNNTFATCANDPTRVLSCPKRKFPVPPRRQDPPPRDWLPSGPMPPSDQLLSGHRDPPPHLTPSLAQPPTPRSSTSPPSLPIKSALTSKFVSLHARLPNASGPNTSTLRLPIPSNLNIPEWRSRLKEYPDRDLSDFLEFGWPIGYSSTTSSPQSSHKNHGSAQSSPQIIADFLSRECKLGATCGPFSSNPLASMLLTSPLQIAYGRLGKPA